MKIKNPFKFNKQIKKLNALVTQFAILGEFSRRGLLHYHKGDSNGGTLLIEESLATIKLAEGEKGFKHFLTQVSQWQNYQLLQEAYDAHRIDIEAKAVREARKKYACLTKADIQRIRQNARDNMSELDHATILGSNPLEFDLFIIRANAPSAEEALNSLPEGEGSGDAGQLLALGHWDGNTLEMALYDDIKHNLH